MAETPADDTTPPALPGPGRLALETAGVAVVAWAWIAWLLRIWQAPLRLPVDTNSDATFISAMVKTMGERGWYLHQPRLGAPFGQEFYDFPHGGETFQLAVMKVLVKITGDWGLAINLYYLAGYGVLAAVTYLVLRHLRFGPVIAAVAALIFTFLPYHLVHAEMHLWRSTYYSAPLAALLLVWAAAWRERFLVEPGRLGRGTLRGNLRWSRVGAALAVAVVVGGTETMTTFFAIALLVSGGIVGAIRWRELGRLVVPGVLASVVGLTFLVLSFPTLNHFRTEGANSTAGDRRVTESELYSLRLTLMVLPQPGGHRFAPFSELGLRSQDRSVLPPDGGQALGILGTAGFFGALYGAFGGRRRTERPDTRPAWDRSGLAEQATANTLLALLFGSVGGLAVVAALAGFTQLRVWGRIVLIIAFFAMVVVARWGELFAGWVQRRSTRPRPILAAVALAVLAFGLWDGVTPQRKPYDEIEARHANDREFVGRIEAALPDGAAVFQYPIIAFPEYPNVGKMVDYDHLRAYLADDGSLRWSYGGIKGRPEADWQQRLRTVPPDVALPVLLGMGFEGLWIDTFGYAGKAAELQALRDEVGTAPQVSSDGRFLFFDLRPYREQVGQTDEQLRQAARRLLDVEPPGATS